MKIKNKQLKSIIKEELHEVLKENFNSSFIKIRDLITDGGESYYQGLELFKVIKGTGALETHEEKLLETINEYALVFYTYQWLEDEKKSLSFNGTFFRAEGDRERYSEINNILYKELTPSLNDIKNKLVNYSNKLFSDVQRGLRNSKKTQIPKEIYIKYMRDSLYRFL